ncbi:Trehalose/maltose import ATP-binding protein MalK [Sulfuracidifex tepidarius]|uniref:Trehalose/maltose import ATP-binding protein MalK n=2 Tax=Sulfuracidifex tepidarius TaxID=1294262 RepID=A0A510DYC9_9CREN|nr:Trehalose/maltose import ATP-binding protein MalK [Sulfuracidifex tepidarius]BBG28037.1 Trehalose/maltose import ATP-binding protein MalK [Sulfuracidifex tepidarius]
MIESETVVDVTDLKKRFGQKYVLKKVSFKVFSGEVFGIVGPNGAGKTTTLRILAGIIRSFEGKVELSGTTPEKAREKGLIAYMPEDTFPYDRLTGIENLRFYAELYAKGDKRKVEEYVETAIKIADLGDRIEDRASEYSRGMKRRLIIARTLMTSPRLAILDEPTSALDVESAINVRHKITDIAREKGVTVLLSSHNMLEVEYLCNRVVMIEGGKTFLEGTPKELVSKMGVQNLEEAFIKMTKMNEGTQQKSF